ncbi:MAG: terminase large subunit [Planctomycetes bacterium]|nr:terminase large subunit [Planctomycetota bacterium]
MAGEPFVLEEWQIGVFANAFGWKRPSKKRRYRKIFLFVPRKNGKSPMAAGVVLYLLLEDGERGAEVYGAARTYKQASVIWSYASGMVRQEPSLDGKCSIFKGQSKSIEYIDPGGFQSIYRVLASDALSEHGQNTSGYCVDEMHALPDGEMIDVLETSTGAREQPLGFYISTSDYEHPNSPCNDMHEYASKVRDGLVDNPYFLPVIFEAGRDDDWTDPEVWARANPNLGVSLTLEYMEEQCKKAQATPVFENTFKRLNLNIRTAQDVRWIQKDKWDACVGEVDATALEKQTCYAGLDLATVSDITAFILAFPVGSKVKLLCFYWVPEDTATQRDKHDRTTYQKWITQGIIRTTPGDMTDYGFVRRDINEIGNRFGIRKIAVDRLFQGAQLGHELAQDGFDVQACGQGFHDMAAPTAHFDRLIRAGVLEHGSCPVLNWMASNVSVNLDPTGSMKPDKVKSSEKIDGIVAAIMAVGLCMAHEERPSVYADRGLLSL